MYVIVFLFIDPVAPFISRLVPGLDETEATTTAMLSVKWEVNKSPPHSTWIAMQSLSIT